MVYFCVGGPWYGTKAGVEGWHLRDQNETHAYQRDQAGIHIHVRLQCTHRQGRNHEPRWLEDDADPGTAQTRLAAAAS